MMMQSFQGLHRERGEGDLAGTGKALRLVHKLREKVMQSGRHLVVEYSQEAVRELGREPGGPWQYYDYSSTIDWGRMKGLHRVRYDLSRIPALSVKKETAAAEGYMVQLLRAVHQANLDDGAWPTAHLLLPCKDPV